MDHRARSRSRLGARGPGTGQRKPGTRRGSSGAGRKELKGFSCQGLIDQLSSQYGDKYTVQQATYGATQAGACRSLLSKIAATTRFWTG
ncbi:MAG: hypothetical protein FJW37_10985 [Acidobacteria bacterium]|nr:hypothetical protein [Acidobacteriota bacterium]